MAAPQLLEIHEDRIQKLEDGQRDICAQLAANTAKLEALSDRVYDGFERIGEHLDALHSKLDGFNTVQGDHQQRVSALEAVNTRRSRRFTSMLKFTAGIVATVVSALLLVKLGIR